MAITIKQIAEQVGKKSDLPTALAHKALGGLLTLIANKPDALETIHDAAMKRKARLKKGGKR